MRSLLKRFVNKLLCGMGPKMTKRFMHAALYMMSTIRKNPATFAYKIHNGLDVDNFLPQKNIDLENGCEMQELLKATTKKRIRIVYPSGTSWSCIGTLYNELIKDERYQVYVITENHPTYLKIMQNQGCTFITLDKYDVKVDKPDVLVLTSYSYTDPSLRFEGVHKYVGKIISLFPNVIINEPGMEEHWRWVRNAYNLIDPDYYLFDSLPFIHSKGYIEPQKALNYGNPLFDELYEKMVVLKSGDDYYSKLKGKKTFLWATDHGLNEYRPIDALSIDLYIKEIFAFFDKHTEYGLIIRLHPYLKREIVDSDAFWTVSDFKRIKDYCDNSPNIIWDEYPEYAAAFLASDALLVDVNCGFTLSYLCTGKPICRLLRNDMDVKLIHPEFKDSYYYAKDFSECEAFINDVLNGNDPKKQLREKTFLSSVKNFDGKNGERIKSFIDDIAFS